jgi:hypothetical protein
MPFYENGRALGNFDTGVEQLVTAVLASPDFLYRAVAPSPDDSGEAFALDDFELASRLSFFLWSQGPDEQLLELAAAGKLRDDDVLEEQVERMLADPRAQSLVTGFALRWLNVDEIDAVDPDNRLFPDFTDALRDDFATEIELFVASVLLEDRDVHDLLTADWTFVNERLARHYGIPNVYGSRFRRVTLPDDSVRGGLLGHGSILTVTSYANRTSPVLRGKWILENILGTPPPPPPPNVPPLPDTAATGTVLSMRERMAQHRVNPACSGCHQLMDPAGLSMENFDAIGRWRTRTEAGTAVDSSGGLPGGSTFDGVAGLRSALLNRPEPFVTTVTEKLLTYALGRGLEYYDAPAVRAIVRQAQGRDYRFSSLVLGIVNSSPFQMRRTAAN